MHRLEAFSLHDFDNQMATFHRFCAKLDLNMDHYPESAWKPDPKAQRTTKGNEMNFIPNLTAFSWKTMQPTAGRRTDSPAMINTRSLQFTLAATSGG